MRVIFMGTPSFAARSLEALLNSGHTVCAVFTRPDVRAGRGMKTKACETKELAVGRGIPVYQPNTLRDEEAAELIRSLEPQAIAVAAYGLLLPQNVLDIPPLGCVNVHGSLLPKYRGAAPVQWAVLNGEKTTGVTTMLMSRGLDRGDMLESVSTEIGREEDAAALYDRLALLGGSLLVSTLDALEKGEAVPQPQDESLATWAPPLTKDMSAVDFSDTAENICNKIRGLQPWPVARAELNGRPFRVYSACPAEGYSAGPGTVLGTDSRGIRVACGNGAVLIRELQAEGGKRMSAADYLRGHSL